MAPPQFQPVWNVTTIVAIVNLVLLVFGGGMAYATLQNGIAALNETDARHEATMNEIRADANGREARLRAVEQGAGRIETKLEAIAESNERINAQIERLNVQIERLIEAQP